MVRVHLENIDLLRNYMVLPEDITNFILKLIKIEWKVQLYEEKIRVRGRDDMLGREIVTLCRSALLDTLMWARLVLLNRFNDYKERVDRLVSDIDKIYDKPEPITKPVAVYTWTARNILDAMIYAKTKWYPFLVRNIVENLDASLVRKEKEDELKLKRKLF